MERLFSGEMPVRVETIVVARFSSIPGIWARMLAGAVLMLTLPGKISLAFRVQVSNSCGRFSVVTPELYSLLMFTFLRDCDRCSNQVDHRFNWLFRGALGL